ncbi:MAG TPA: helix-turn-helix transcriptional regulator [Longimicrobiales bacterium]|jgi:DNA-binding PadR family transcriptional regulator
MSDAPSPDGSLPLHPLEFRILLVLLRGAGHGYRIVKEIEASEAGRLYPANLYRRIRNLLGKGLIEETGPPEDEVEPDPRRTYFRVTGLGRDVARAEARRLEELVLEARDRDLLEPA